MVKTVVGLTRPTPACRDTPLRGTAAARFRDAKNNEAHGAMKKSTMSVRPTLRCARRRRSRLKSAHGREVHDAPKKARHGCERRRDGEPAVSRERPVSSERCENEAR